VGVVAPFIVMFSLLASVNLHDSLDDGSIADAIAFGMGNKQSPLKGFKLGRSLTDDLNPEAFKVRKLRSFANDRFLLGDSD
jgi:hypothetical protein